MKNVMGLESESQTSFFYIFLVNKENATGELQRRCYQLMVNARTETIVTETVLPIKLQVNRP